MKIITLNLEGIENAAKRGFIDWMLDQAADFSSRRSSQLKARALDN